MTLDLAALGYQRHGTSRLWVPEGTDAPEFGYNDGDDYETWVATSVRDATDVSSLSREVERHIRDWPSRYHLSHQRANLVRPLLPSVTGPVLEVGAGMGAVTRGLGEAGLEVVAVEGSPRRASVCADRCRDLPNVQVVADTIQGFGHPRRFQTVVMVGVLEYSRVFGFDAGDRDPVDVMLEHIVGLLEPDGQLVLAIENQLGLKYFAGFPEDHVGRRMFGLEDRYAPDGVVTFGRDELARRLRGAGLTHLDWYYPFPDYKLPTTVVAHDALEHDGFDVLPLVAATGHADHQEPATTAMDLTRAWGPVVRNGLVADLSSSFLVRASAAELSPVGPLAWYFGSSARRPEFAKVTTFERTADGVEVRRRRPLPDLATTVAGIGVRLEDERYLGGAPWSATLADRLGREGWRAEDVAEWLGTWLAAFCERAGVDPAAGPEATVSGDLLDALPRNLLVLPDGPRFIDLEWVSAEPLTLGYAVFRALYDSLASLGPVAAPADGTPLVLRDVLVAAAAAHGVALTDADLAAHWERERAFQSTVLGAPVATDAVQALGAHLRVRTDLDAVIASHERLPALEAGLREDALRHATLLEQTREELDRTRAGLEGELAQATGAAEGLGAAAHALRAQVEDLHRSTSWRVTAPLRVTSRQAARARRVAGRLLRGGTLRAAAPTPPPAGPDVTADLDLAYYRARHPDLAGLDDAQLTAHFRDHGHAEGRLGRSLMSTADVHVRHLDPARETVLLVLHEASRTGAPVLGWNLARELGARRDVVVVLLRGGELADDLRQVAAATVRLDVDPDTWVPHDAEALAADLVSRFRPSWALANSAATHALVPALDRAGVPVVALVHEFGSSMRPAGVLAGMFATASEVVFSAPIVAESMRREYADLLAREPHVVPQGQSELPPGAADAPGARPTPIGTDGVDADLPERDAAEYLAGLEPDAVLVLGAGTVSPRKGVEFFLQAADHVRRTRPDAPVRFAWVGHRIGPLQWYVEELHEQLLRSGVGDRVTFLAPVADLGPLFERADVFLLSSRLDPLPNVTIDAALAGVPVVAFDGASGFAEWLAADPRLSGLVVPHLDATAAGALVLDLADDPARRQELGQVLRSAGRLAFDMSLYAERLEALGAAARARRDQEARDVETIRGAGAFDPALYTDPSREGADPGTLLAEYVHRSALTTPRARPRTGLLVRRPVPGFHPLAYAEQAPGYDEARDGDPLADFLRRGRPAGPWLREVLGPDAAEVRGDTGARVLVHGHFHYPELVDDLLTRLALNTHPVHLHLTTGTRAGADLLEQRVAQSGLPSWEVEVVPNRGRDLAPLLTGIGRRALDHDLVLHVHGKKSPHVDPEVGDRWRTFLYENLVGGREPMLDVICAAFADRPALGLVSPEDPHLNDWDLNRPQGERLAARLGLATPLTTHFDFPLGTMFWARTEALRPLLEAGFDWSEYPAEPLPIDGTVLHALERLVPFVVADRGFGYAKSAVPGIVR